MNDETKVPRHLSRVPGPVSDRGNRRDMSNITPMWENCTMTRHFLGITEVAARTGLSRETVKAYARDGYLPAPDATIGDTRGWSIPSIDKWMAARPGRGARTDLAGPKGKK